MREMKTLEVDKWAPGDRPGLVKHAGMISPQEAFNALEAHLAKEGLLPDEYFIAGGWKYENRPQLPDYRQANCCVNWGGSEGIYLDISLVYRSGNEVKYFDFATGKTLGQSGDDFLRMSRIAAECSMMLNGRGEVVRFYEDEKQKEPAADNELVSLDSAILDAQNRQAATLSEVVAFLDSVPASAVSEFTKKFGVAPQDLRSNSSFLSLISSEMDRLGAENPGLLAGSNDNLIRTALFNVCLSHCERQQQQRLTELKQAKRQKDEVCL